MDLMHIPLTELKIAKTNVRHGVKKADFKDLIPSIKERGILQPLLVRPNGQGYEIVAGRRRFLAACELEKEGTAIDAVPCAVMAKGDDAEAVEASLIENVAHLPMDEMDQFEAFQRLLKEGRSVEDIAHVFGVTELTVKRRLAIANLHPKIRQLYRAEEIDAETLRALTLASKQQQKDWLALWDDEEQHAPRGSYLKKWLLGGENIPTSVALFDLAQYQGQIITDLFGEEQFFANAEGFWALQDQAINAKRDDYLAQGWPRCEVLPRGTRFYEWEYQKAGKKKGGAVWIAVSERGEVELHEGYDSREEARKREKQKRGETDRPKAAKPELTAPMQNYVELHRLAAIRLELLNHPQIALRLTLAHMIVGSSLWMIKPEPMKPAKPEIGASVAANPATGYFEERRKELVSLLGFDEDREALVRPNGDDYGLANLFAQLLKLPDEDVLRLMALAMVETLVAGTATAELAGAVTGATMNDWRPDDTFFDLLNGKDVVNALLTDAGNATIADGNKAEPAKLQKGIIRDIMRGENGREQNADWLPGYFRFSHPDSYRPWRNCHSRQMGVRGRIAHPCIIKFPPLNRLAGLRACFSLAPHMKSCRQWAVEVSRSGSRSRQRSNSPSDLHGSDWCRFSRRSDSADRGEAHIFHAEAISLLATSQFPKSGALPAAEVQSSAVLFKMERGLREHECWHS